MFLSVHLGGGSNQTRPTRLHILSVPNLVERAEVEVARRIVKLFLRYFEQQKSRLVAPTAAAMTIFFLFEFVWVHGWIPLPIAFHWKSFTLGPRLLRPLKQRLTYFCSLNQGKSYFCSGKGLKKNTFWNRRLQRLSFSPANKPKPPATTGAAPTESLRWAYRDTWRISTPVGCGAPVAFG